MSISIPYLKQHQNGTYYIHWTENRKGKRRTTGTKDLAKAKAVLGHFLTLEAREPSALPGENVTLADCWSVYKERHIDTKVASVENAVYAWRQMEPFFGALKVSHLSQKVIDDYIERRTSGKIGRKVKPQTVRRELTYILAAVKFCSRPRIGLVDPKLVQGFELPEPGEPRDRWLTPTEIQKLLDAAARLRRGPRLSRGERFIWLALETAGRAQAILDLTWDRVDFETRVIHLDVPGRRKTNKGRATVPISRALLPILERAYKERFIVSRKYGRREMTHVLDNNARIWSTIQLIAIEAGFGGERPKVLRSQKPKATGISPHVLRHTAATHMARRGVPLFHIAKILGNSVRMVETVYAKHAPDDLRAAVDAISNGQLEPAE